ncbi:MAG: alpha/beta hydrolase [Dokdonella sp.]
MRVNDTGAQRAAEPPPAEAGYFGPATRPRFGWLHRATVPANAVGLVIVPPFGYEAVCAQRSLRHLAEDAARAGITAVRFDLDGSGDSAGDDLDVDRLGNWLASIDDACALARTAGADRIVLAGVRLGAILATLAAARRDDVAGLVAIAAVAGGKAWLREGRALQMALGLTPDPAPAGDDVQEIVGFALTAETRAALAAIDLLKIQQLPAPSILLIDRDDLASNDALAAHLATLGAEVETQRLPGYVEMMLDPHRALVPQPMLDATIAFAASRPRFQAPVDHATAVLTQQANLECDGVAIREQAVHLDGALFGIATFPPDAPQRALILLNAGAVGRIGPNRLHVALARRLAAAGDLVLRLDLSGLGDSRARHGAKENVVYHAHAVDDIGVAVDWARGDGASKIAVAGLCSGAYHSLGAALARQTIDTIVMINPLTFHYKPGMSLELAAFRVITDAQRYQKSMTRGVSWRKLLRGDVDLKRVADVMARRAWGTIDRPWRELRRRLHLPQRDDLGAKLDTLARQGTALRFVFAGDDPGRFLLLEEGGSVVARLRDSGRLAVQVIEGADHTFTPRWSHRLLLDAVAQSLAR